MELPFSTQLQSQRIVVKNCEESQPPLWWNCLFNTASIAKDRGKKLRREPAASLVESPFSTQLQSQRIVVKNCDKSQPPLWWDLALLNTASIAKDRGRKLRREPAASLVESPFSTQLQSVFYSAYTPEVSYHQKFNYGNNIVFLDSKCNKT